MSQIITIDEQCFANLREKNCFYIDKTKFIKNWWLQGDPITLVTRPRRFGKTLMVDAVRTFFSPEFANRSDLFEGLEIWEDEKFRNLQGKIPVIFLSFAKFNDNTYEKTISRIKESLASIYDSFASYIDINAISMHGKELFTHTHKSMSDVEAKNSLHYLCHFMKLQQKIRPIIILDAYDTPLIHAWLNGYFDELINFMRVFFASTFKTNPYLERALITGITLIDDKSLFSYLNNNFSSVTSDIYSDCFGFTEHEVFKAMDTYGLTNKEEVKKLYGGFIFGDQKEIYNPWDIINFLSNKKLDTYWANTSSNSLVSDLLISSDQIVKRQTESLLNGKSIMTKLKEEIVFDQPYTQQVDIWSLLMAAGYVKPLAIDTAYDKYELTLTNFEARIILENKISEWFEELKNSDDNNFIKALLENNLYLMNKIMDEIVIRTFNYFDPKNKVQNDKYKSECFYHCFVLALLVNLKDRYSISSNRKSGYGRYDICLYPNTLCDPGIVIEFKVIDTDKEENLKKTCDNALKQIKEKSYITDLLAHNVPKNNIYVYGFAFQGKNVLISGGAEEKIDWMSILPTA